MNVYLESVELWEFASCYRNYKVCQGSELLGGEAEVEKRRAGRVRGGCGERGRGRNLRVTMTASVRKCLLGVSPETRCCCSLEN